MSENKNAMEKFKKDVLYHLRSIEGKRANWKAYEKIAIRLSKLVGKTPAWTWRYVQCVYAGSIEPSKKFAHALERMYISPEPRYPEWLGAIKKNVRRMVRDTNKQVLKDWRP